MCTITYLRYWHIPVMFPMEPDGMRIVLMSIWTDSTSNDGLNKYNRDNLTNRLRFIIAVYFTQSMSWKSNSALIWKSLYKQLLRNHSITMVRILIKKLVCNCTTNIPRYWHIAIYLKMSFKILPNRGYIVSLVTLPPFYNKSIYFHQLPIKFEKSHHPFDDHYQCFLMAVWVICFLLILINYMIKLLPVYIVSTCSKRAVSAGYKYFWTINL